MRVFCHNFNYESNSGPNKFTRQMLRCLAKDKKITLSKNQDDSDVEFSLIQMMCEKKKPMILRLDGIYFNSEQDYENQNLPIKYAYDQSDAVVFQSNFNKKLTEKWFGVHSNSSVIHNGADLDFINSVHNDRFDTSIDRSTEVWSCASSWRPHKRLGENLRYFHEKSPKNSIMIVAGNNACIKTLREYNEITNGRVYYLGELDYYHLISLYKRSSTFVHLSYLDHCPNVVVDAQASGCKIICSSTGGTKEIVKNGEIISEKEWDFSPTKLYDPPSMDFSNYWIKSSEEDLHSIQNASDMYFEKMRSIIV